MKPSVWFEPLSSEWTFFLLNDQLIIFSYVEIRKNSQEVDNT